jgi:acetyl esterase/lipase
MRRALILLLASSAACIPDAAAAPTVARSTFSYGSDAAQRLDLYTPVPAPAAPAPTVLLAHGGLWQSGDRGMLAALCTAIVQQSGHRYACASIDYRLSQDLGGACSPPGAATYRSQVEDMAAAYAWLQQNAAARGLDPQKMYVGGHSSGGHLAHELNLRWTAFAPGPCGATGCAPPVGAVGFEGIYDVYAWDAYDKDHWGASFSCATRQAFGAPPTVTPSCVEAATKQPCWDDGSPRVLAQNAAKLGAAPAGGALVIHSPGDDWVDLGEATAFGKAFSAAFPGKGLVVETGGKCATGEHNDVLFEPSLAGCIVRFMGSGGTSL